MEFEREIQNDCNWNFTIIQLFNNNNSSSILVSQYVNNGYVIGAFSLLFLIIGLPWNALVIGIILKKKLFTRPTYMLMLNLAIANLLVCVLVLPLSVATGFGGKDVFKDSQAIERVCQTAVFLILFPLVSTNTVTLIAIDRLVYIKRPLSYHSIVTPWRMLVVIVVVWVLCIGLSIPALALSTFLYFPIIQACTADFSPGDLEFLIPVIVECGFVVLLQWVVCVWMICIARKQLKKRLFSKLSQVARFRRVYGVTTQELPQNRKNTALVQKEYKKSQLHLVKVFVAIFAASTVTLFLVGALVIIVPICGDLPPLLYPPPHLLYLSRAIVHPILEAVMTKEISSVLQSFIPTRLKVCFKTRKQIANGSKS